MKKLSFIALVFITLFATSCGETGEEVDQSLIVGKWMTADSTYFEVYRSDGTGKTWNLKEDVQEEEAQTFTWEFDEGNDKKFIQYHEMEISDAVVPQYCNIIELTSKTFKYNNNGFRATYNLVRAE